MAWDGVAADEMAAAFEQFLQKLIASDPKAAEVTRQIAQEWSNRYMVAGHKRLGRALVNIAKKTSG
jgi:hypothetical protein